MEGDSLILSRDTLSSSQISDSAGPLFDLSFRTYGSPISRIRVGRDAADMSLRLYNIQSGY